jgi:hypothetical protein
MQEQIDASGMDFREETHQVLKASAQTVDRPSHHNVKFAPGRSLVQGIELRPSARCCISGFDARPNQANQDANCAMLRPHGL